MMDMGNEEQSTTADRTKQWCGVLQRAGYRLTPARRGVVATIADYVGPFNAAQILARAQAKQPRLGLATVYRTLETLDALLLIQRLHDNQGCHSYLALAEDNLSFIRCSNCGRLDYVEGVARQGLIDTNALQALIDTVAVHCNYQIARYSLQLHGLCEECQ